MNRTLDRNADCARREKFANFASSRFSKGIISLISAPSIHLPPGALPFGQPESLECR
jgi:hypothetical protein